MTKAELIEVAKRCVSGTCYKCPFRKCESKPENDCRGNMIWALAEELENNTSVCMPGDKVYQFSDGAVYENTVQQIIYDCGHIAFAEGAIGRHIFLTREAAERVGADNENR